MRSAFEAGGDIRGVDILASLATSWRERGSGSLRFSRSGATAGFDIAGGEIVDSFSSQARFEVAAILGRAGKLDPAAVARLERPETVDAAIAAMQAGLISAKEWKWGRKIRAIEILSDVLGWLEGEYVWDPAAVAPTGDSPLPIPRLVLELFLRSRDRTLVEHHLGPSDLPLLRAERFDSEFEGFGLTADASSVVRLVDGRATAEEIAEKAPADEFAVLKLLAALTTLGLIHPLEAAPGTPPARRKRKERPRPPVQPPPAAPEVPSEPSPPEPAPAPAEPSPPLAEAPEGLEPPPPPAVESLEPEGGFEADLKRRLEEEPEEREPARVPEKEPPGARPEPPSEALPVLSFAPLGEPEPPVPARQEPSILDIEPPGPIDRELLTEPGLPSDTPPPVAGRRSGAVLGALLALLVIAVAAVLVLRSPSRGAREVAAATTPSPSPQEAPVFPPAETAIPLARRGRSGVTPSPPAGPSRTATSAPFVAAPPSASPTKIALSRTPSSSPTHVAPTKTATLTATHPAPTKTPTARPPSPPPTRTLTRIPTRPSPTRTPTNIPTRPAPTKTPTLVPTRPAPTRTAVPPPARPIPTKKPPTAAPTVRVPTRPPAPTPSPAPTFAAPAGLSRAEWMRRAERDRQALARRGNARYAVQLELACEIETLVKAWAWDRPAGTMWLLTTSYRGRTCFRVLWGHYKTLAEANTARGRVPSFFISAGNRPTPVLLR